MKTRQTLYSVIFLLSVFSLAAHGQTDDLTDMTEEIVVKTKDAAQARKQAQKELVNRVTFKLAEDLLGPQKAEQSRSLITNKIAPDYEKYIPLIRKADPIAVGDDTKFRFNLKVSLSSFRTLLLNEGILQTADAPVAVLPLLTVHDQLQGRSYYWWGFDPAHVDSKDPLMILSQRLHARLQDGFQRTGLHFLNPMTGQYAVWLPSSMRRESLAPDDHQWMARFFKAPVVITGALTLQRASGTSMKTQVGLHLSALQTKQLRTVAEANDTFEVDLIDGALPTDEFKKLADQVTTQLVSQLSEVWSRGGLSTETIYLNLQGEVKPPELDRLKANLLKSVRSIRSLRERRFSSGAVTLELDSVVSAADLTKELSRERIVEGFDLKLNSTNGATVAGRITVLR